jgi:penicillin amidase
MFAIARTPNLAWGVTYLKGDTSDYFIEDCRREDNRWQYRRGQKWHDFLVRTESIDSKGGKSESLHVYYNEQGTLENDLSNAEDGLYLLTAWTGDHEGVGQSITTWLDLIECDTTRDGMNLVRECPQPTLCWVFADRQGHIGRQANGWFPRRRKGNTGLTPVPAWDERNHWQGWLSVDDLPSKYDPPEGFLASANEDINPPGGPMLITQPVPYYRKQRIVECLARWPSATLENMQTLQYDVLSVQARELLEVLLSHLPPGEIKQRFEDWDYRYNPESLEATLFQRFYRNVLLEIFGQDPHQEGGVGWRRMLYLCSRVGFSLMVVTCIDRLLKKESSLWWRHRDKGEMIRHAALRLTDEPDQPWSVTNAFSFTNRFFEGHLVGRALGLNSSEMPMAGCHATPFQGHLLRLARREETFAPSYHFVTDLGRDEAWTNLPGGPSESRFSGLYTIDIQRWADGQYKLLELDAQG